MAGRKVWMLFGPLPFKSALSALSPASGINYLRLHAREEGYEIWHNGVPGPFETEKRLPSRPRASPRPGHLATSSR